MIDIESEDFNENSGIFTSVIHLYGVDKNECNKEIAKYVNKRINMVHNYIFNEQLGSSVLVQGKNNDYFYTFKITIQYSKLHIGFNSKSRQHKKIL